MRRAHVGQHWTRWGDTELLARQERSLARICREGIRTIQREASGQNVAVSANDRSLASGLAPPPRRAISRRHPSPEPPLLGSLPRTPHTPTGAVLMVTRRVKEEKYRELLEGGKCRLVVVGIETGGRWSPEAVEFVDFYWREPGHVRLRLCCDGPWPMEADVGGVMRSRISQFHGVQIVGHSGHRRGSA